MFFFSHHYYAVFPFDCFFFFFFIKSYKYLHGKYESKETMSLIVDQDSNFKHFCKICEKGFMCGRALGGHMRTHGTGDEIESLDNDWEEKDVGSNGGTSPPNNKRMYGLRVKPNRPGTSKGSENCGMESLSCKSFLHHGKFICHDDV